MSLRRLYAFRLISPALFFFLLALQPMGRAQGIDTAVGVPVRIWGSAVYHNYIGDPGGLDLSLPVMPSTTYPTGDFSVSWGSTYTNNTPFPNPRQISTVKLMPGKIYPLSITAEQVSSLSVTIVAPQGYQVEMAGVAQSTFSLTAGPNYFGTIPVRIVPSDELVGRAGEASSFTSGRVFWQAALGYLRNGASAGALTLADPGLDADWTALGAKSSLQYNATSSEILVHKDAGALGLRQIRTNQSTVDIVTVDSASYRMDFYDPTQAIGASFPYTFSGSPYISYTVAHVAATKLQITSVTSSRTAVTTLERTGAASPYSWNLQDWNTSGQSQLSEELRVGSAGTASDRVENRFVRQPTLAKVTDATKTYRPFTWGEELVQATMGSTNTVTATMDYYSDSALKGSYAFLKSRTSTDGTWEAYDYDDSNTYKIGFAKTRYRPFNGFPTAISFDPAQGEVTTFDFAMDAFGAYTRPTQVLTKVKNQTTSQSNTSYSDSAYAGSPTLYLVTATRSDYASGSSSLTSITKYFREDAGVLPHPTTGVPNIAEEFYRGQLFSLQRADGVKQSFAYQRGDFTESTGAFAVNTTGSAFRTVSITGSAAAGTSYSNYIGFAIDPVGLIAEKSTLQVVVRDSRALVRRTEVHVWSGGIWNQVSWTNLTYDSAGFLTGRTASNGAVFSASYSGEQKDFEIDETGVKISYVYDVAGRTLRATKEGGPTSTFTYDAESRLLSSSTSAAALPQPSDEKITASRAFDDAGRLTSETSPGPNGPVSTSFTYTPNSREVTVALPNGGTRTETYQIDGTLAQVTGTAVIPEYYTYDVLAGGTRYARSNLSTSVSARQRENWSDWLGRQTQSSRPGFSGQPAYVEQAFFDSTNGTGRLLKTTRTFSATAVSSTLFQYDALSQVVRAGSDLSAPLNDSLDLASADRIVDRDQYFESYNSAWWLTRVKKAYPKDSNAAPLVISTTRERLTGLAGTTAYGVLMAEALITDVDGNATTRQSSVNRATKTITRTTTASGLGNTRIETSVNGLATSLNDFDGLAYSTGYDSLQRPATRVAPRTGTSTTYFYFGSNAVWKVADAAANLVATHIYDNAGRVVETRDAASNVTYTAYNKRDQVIRRWGSAATPSEYAYGPFGEQIAMRTFRSTSINFAPTTRVWPLADSGLDASDTPTHTSWTTGDKTTWAYDGPSGLVTAKTDASNRSVGYTYNARGQTATRTWARNVTTTYSYWGDAAGELQTGQLRLKSYSDTTPAVSYTYTRSGQLATAADTLTGSRSFVYNDLQPFQLDAVGLGDFYGNSAHNSAYNRVLTRQYDSVKRSTGFYLGDTTRGLTADLTQTYTYNTLGRFDHVDSVSTAQVARTFSYSYNTGGLVSGLGIVGNAFSVSLDYESNRDLLTKIDSLWSGVSRTRYDYTYNALAQRVTAKQSSDLATGAFGDFGGSTYQRYVYNPRGEVTDAATYLGEDATSTSSPQLSGRHHALAYDQAGNRQSSTRNAGAGVDDLYGANSLNQYDTRENHVVHTAGTVANGAAVTVSGGSPAPVVARQGRYWDARVMLPNTGGPAKGSVTVASTLPGAGSGGADLVRTETKTALIGAALQAFTYDLDGNLTGDGIWAYSYDAENRLIAMETFAASIGAIPAADARRLQFAYDYLGRRVQKAVYSGWNGVAYTVLSSARRFLYDGDNLVAEFDAPNGSACGALVRSYTWGLDLAGTLTGTGGIGALVQVTDHATSTAYFPTYDGNGNVASLVRAADGVIAAAYEYSPFGELLRSTGAYALANPFRFSTKFTDDESGLVYYGARFYSPVLGRFINRDPIGEAGGLNLYGFAGNDGVNGYDYLGYSWLSSALSRLGNWIKGHIPVVVATIAAVVTVVVGGWQYPESWRRAGEVFENVYVRLKGAEAVANAVSGSGGGGGGSGPPRTGAVSQRGSLVMHFGVDLDDLAHGARAAQEGAGLYVIGLGEGLWGAVTGTLEAIADPVNTLKGAGAVVRAATEGVATVAAQVIYDRSELASDARAGAASIKNGAAAILNDPRRMGQIVGNVEGAVALGAGINSATRAAGRVLTVKEELQVMRQVEQQQAAKQAVSKAPDRGPVRQQIEQQQAAKEGAKPGPKPKGTGPHNEMIEKRIAELKKDGYQHLNGGLEGAEEVVDTAGGFKSSRRPDITMEAPDGSIYRENIGKTRVDGTPVTREVRALDDLEKATGTRPVFTPYDR